MARRSLSGFLSRSPFLDVYRQEGENNGYVAFTTGTNVTVNAAASKLLAWTYTPPVDVWAEVSFYVGLVQKTDAAYHYAYLTALCTPIAAIGSPAAVYLTQHSTVQTFEHYTITKLWGLTAGVAYSMYPQWSTSGGTWQYNQSAGILWMQGKSWPR